MSHSSMQSQRGATALIVALWMTVAMSCLMVIDIGNIFWQKRELQKIADLAALAGASGTVQDSCRPVSGSAAQENAVVNGLGSGSGDLLKAQAGSWSPKGSDPSAFFQAGGALMNACHVEVERTVPYLFVINAKNGGGRTVIAQATALQNSPIAKIGIRSTLAKLATENSALLNLLVGGLLGGKLNLSAVSWEAIAGLDLNLLKYLKALDLELNGKIAVGDYKDVLTTELGLGWLLEVMIEALQQQHDTLDLDLEVLKEIQALAKIDGVKVQLAQLLGIQTGTPVSALDASLNVLELVHVFAQVANSKHAAQAVVNVPTEFLGLGLPNVKVALSLIEPPQMSAIGNPFDINSSPIYLRTSQLRLLLSVDAANYMGPLVSILDGIIDTVLLVLSPVLNLVNFLTGGVDFTSGKTQYLVPNLLLESLRLDIGIDVGGGDVRVVGASCDANGKSLEILTNSSAARVRVGNWGSNTEEAQENAFSNKMAPDIGPIKLLRLDCRGCKEKNKIAEQYYGGLGLSLDLDVGNKYLNNYKTVPALDIEEEPRWTEGTEMNKVVANLGKSIGGLKALEFLSPDEEFKGLGLSGVLQGVTGLVSGIISIVGSLLSSILAPILDPILDFLLDLLGINLGLVEISPHLKCGGGAELVY